MTSSLGCQQYKKILCYIVVSELGTRTFGTRTFVTRQRECIIFSARHHAICFTKVSRHGYPVGSQSGA